MIIIGITGTLGAGKGTVVEYLVSHYGFKHYSARSYISEEIERRGLPVNRDNMVTVANDLRAKHNPAFVVEELYKQAVQTNSNAVIESVRTVGEVEFLKNQPNFYLLAVDADEQSRYQRISLRKSTTDFISYDKFLEDEKLEMASSDSTKQNLLECIQKADFVLSNDGPLMDLQNQIDKIINKIQS